MIYLVTLFLPETVLYFHAIQRDELATTESEQESEISSGVEDQLGGQRNVMGETVETASYHTDEEKKEERTEREEEGLFSTSVSMTPLLNFNNFMK